ncbi:MAG: hypothetical protein LAP61_05650 [Acidobacteriia bacterium]|nr:hypothetical protein [Terriglobia bacterium]
MLYVNKITSDPSQQLTLTGIPTLQIGMTLRFMPRIQRWIMGVTYNSFEAEGIAVVTSLNLLRQFKDNIPFGISCVTTNGLDPYRIDDFVNQVANLYLMDATDVAEVEKDWFT